MNILNLESQVSSGLNAVFTLIFDLLIVFVSDRTLLDSASNVCVNRVI